MEVNKETGLIWVTINPPHGHGHDEEDNVGHGHDHETNNHSHNNDEEDNHGPNNNNDGHGNEHDEGTGEIVAAYDIFTLEKVEEYAAGSHPAHVSITKDGNTVVFSNSGDNTVTIIDRATEEAAVIETGEYPHGLRISPDQKSPSLTWKRWKKQSVWTLENTRTGYLFTNKTSSMSLHPKVGGYSLSLFRRRFGLHY